jgi:hypothetical protein
MTMLLLVGSGTPPYFYCLDRLHRLHSSEPTQRLRSPSALLKAAVPARSLEPTQQMVGDNPGPLRAHLAEFSRGSTALQHLEGAVPL